MENTVIVIGGGISGVSFAHFCAINGYSVKLYEKSTLGGCINSFKYSDESFLELGGHTLTNKYRTVLEILEFYGQLNQIKATKKLRFEGYENGIFISLLKKIRFKSLIFSLKNLLLSSKQNSTLKEYYGSILGAKNFEQLFFYLFRAILCQDPTEYPAELLFKKRKKTKKVPTKFVLKKGIIQIFDIIKENSNILCYENTSITKVNFENGKYHIWNGTNYLGFSSNLCFACSPKITSKLLLKVAPLVSKHLENIKNNYVEAILVSVKNQKKVSKRHRSILSFGETFYSAVYYKTLGKKMWVFYFKGKEIGANEKIAEIAKIFDIEPKEIESLAERTMALPKIGLKDKRNIEDLRRLIEDKRLFIVSNYISGLSIEDCCMTAKEETKRLLNFNTH